MHVIIQFVCNVGNGLLSQRSPHCSKWTDRKWVRLTLWHTSLQQKRSAPSRLDNTQMSHCRDIATYYSSLPNTDHLSLTAEIPGTHHSSRGFCELSSIRINCPQTSRTSNISVRTIVTVDLVSIRLQRNWETMQVSWTWRRYCTISIRSGCIIYWHSLVLVQFGICESIPEWI